MGANNADFHGYTFELQEGPVNHVITARTSDGKRVGELGLHKFGSTASISWITVHPDWRRKGIATAMWKHANDLHNQGILEKKPEMSGFRTIDGDNWAKSLGEDIPENRTPPEESNPKYLDKEAWGR
jgi:GNAT superfamily N-acetyltransferase